MQGYRKRADALALVFVLVGCFSDAPPIDDGASSSGSTRGTSGGPSSDDSDEHSGSTQGTATSSVTATSADATTSPVESESGATETGDRPPFCATIGDEISETIQACTDFDNMGGEVGTWTVLEELGGVVEIAPETDAPSQPNALRASFVAMATPAPRAEVHHDLGASLFLTHLQFRMELEACDGAVPLAQLQYGGPQPYVVALQTTGSTLVLAIRDGRGTTMLYPLDPAVLAAAGPWATWEIAVEVDFDFVDIIVDGMPAVHVDNAGAPARLPDPPTIHLGVLGGDPGFGCAAWFDDVVVF